MATRKPNSMTTRPTTTTPAKKPAGNGRLTPAAVAAPIKPTASAPVKTITQAERQKLIEQAAYFRAEKVGFQGNAQEHWSAALAEVDADLARKKIRVV